MPVTRHTYRQRGFTLAEIAIAFVIVALLIGGAVLTFSAQNDARQVADTQRILEQARDAILGFAIRADRFPCPAPGGATGVETFTAPGAAPPNTDHTCNTSVPGAGVAVGFVPALTLGIGPTDPQGYLVDAWGNRVRYAVSTWSQAALDITQCPPNQTPPDFTRCPAFTTSGAMKGLGFAALPATPPGLIRICDASGCGGLQFSAPAVLYSTGRNLLTLTSATIGLDEDANIHIGGPAGPVDATFVAHEPRPAGAPGGAFDDLVIWVSPNILYNRLIAAGAI